MALSSIVKLFRMADKPQIHRGSFSSNIPFNREVTELVNSIQSQYSALFDEIFVDGTEVLGAILPEDGKEIKFTLKLPSRDANKFYESLPDLISNTPQVSRGDLPSQFYLIDKDYLNGTDSPIPEIEKLSTICKLIKGLSELAHYHEARSTDHLKLIFIQPGESSESSIGVFELETNISTEMLDGPTPDISLVESLQVETPEIDPHYSSKRGVFWVSLSEFIKRRPGNQSAFSFLVLKWKDFLLLYQQNLGTYLSGFAFHKAKKEVAEEEFKIAEQLSNIVSDITGKLLSIPLSLAATIAIVSSESILERLFIVFGLLLAALILSGTVANQQRQLIRISHAKDVVLNALEGKLETYPDELKTKVEEMKSGLDRNQTKLNQLLWTFRVLSWIPVILGTALVVELYTTWLFF